MRRGAAKRGLPVLDDERETHVRGLALGGRDVQVDAVPCQAPTIRGHDRSPVGEILGQSPQLPEPDRGLRVCQPPLVAGRALAALLFGRGGSGSG